MSPATSTGTPAHLPILAHWIDGQAVPAKGPGLDVVNPATGTVIASAPQGTAEDVDRAVGAAAAAFPAWSATDLAQRVAAMRRIADGLEQRTEELAAVITAEMGSPISFSRQAQAGFPAHAIAAAITVAEEFTWSEQIGNSMIVREPIGVVGAITPWNFPLQQIVTKVVPALLAGNTVVLKPSEVTPHTAQIFAEVTAEAGLPAGVFNLVHGTGPVVGEAITRHSGVGMVSFTGSTAAGKRVAEAASATVKRVSTELGGKAAYIVLPEADLDEAVNQGLAMAWVNAGQACGAWTRMLVPAAAHDSMVEKLREAATGYTTGDPTDEATTIGPLASEAQRERVNAFIEKGIADGATLVAGGPDRPEGLETGAYVRPTIFADVDPDSVIAREEIFGPVLTVIPYSDDDEAVAIANDTVYGLSAAVAGDRDHALALARRIQVGQVTVNGGDYNFMAPWGGYKQSGNGRELGRAGFEEFLETKAINI
ncbi:MULTISPECIES: aldehyde dehydrogenase family protein [unclassified Streptomyces]|uniref:aldehyde dehydrogenase family protein n=1 Tax=unclassified Streptomyces TaxID=2593676 RepID=UPI0003659956|nr:MULTISPECIES: aldehyde dehydrogenase family protein [unclassified Streptomyces]MYX37603.1 aldehyde dehydrogenase family protein [Streptomyces sp. SID8377]